jgi:hypothetical protein
MSLPGTAFVGIWHRLVLGAEALAYRGEYARTRRVAGARATPQARLLHEV